MFEINKEEVAKEEIFHEAHKMMARMMGQMILESNAPEVQKYVVRIIDKIGDIQEFMRSEIVEKYCDPENLANEETLSKIYEYLQLVEVGIKQFIKTTQLVADETEEDDEVC